MGRRKNEEHKKPGRKSDFDAEQTLFLESYSERFQTGSRSNTFYTEIANDWINKFGYAVLNPHTKNAIDISELRLDADLDTLTTDERKKILERRETAKQNLRGKIGNWFRHHYNYRKKDQDGVDEVMASMLQTLASRPRRKSEIAMYSELYYNTKLKRAFDAMWEGCVQGGVPSDQRIHLLRNFTKESWAKESPELQAEIKKRCENEHAEAMEAWKGRTKWIGSSEDYRTALANIDAVIPPFADAISKYTGMVAIVTLVGPSSENGELIVRRQVPVSPRRAISHLKMRYSSQSTSKEKLKQTWAQADLAGYRSFQQSLFNYARAFFSETECKARVVKDAPTDPQDSDVPAEQALPVVVGNASDAFSPIAGPVRDASAVLPENLLELGLLTIPQLSVAEESSFVPTQSQSLLVPTLTSGNDTWNGDRPWGEDDWRAWEDLSATFDHPFALDENLDTFNNPIPFTGPDPSVRTLPTLPAVGCNMLATGFALPTLPVVEGGDQRFPTNYQASTLPAAPNPLAEALAVPPIPASSAALTQVLEAPPAAAFPAVDPNSSSSILDTSNGGVPSGLASSIQPLPAVPATDVGSLASHETLLLQPAPFKHVLQTAPTLPTVSAASPFTVPSVAQDHALPSPPVLDADPSTVLPPDRPKAANKKTTVKNGASKKVSSKNVLAEGDPQPANVAKGLKRKRDVGDENANPAEGSQPKGKRKKGVSPNPLTTVEAQTTVDKTVDANTLPVRRTRGPAAYLIDARYVPPKKGTRAPRTKA